MCLVCAHGCWPLERSEVSDVELELHVVMSYPSQNLTLQKKWALFNFGAISPALPSPWNGSLTGLGSWIWLCWLTGRSAPAICCLCLPSIDVQAHSIMRYMGSGNWTQSLLLSRQMLYWLSHLLNLSFIFYNKDVLLVFLIIRLKEKRIDFIILFT